MCGNITTSAFQVRYNPTDQCQIIIRKDYIKYRCTIFMARTLIYRKIYSLSTRMIVLFIYNVYHTSKPI